MDNLNATILQILHDEHMATMVLLEQLETMLRQNKPASPPNSDDKQAQAILIELIAMLEDEITHHYSFEEEYLFPLFRQRFNPGVPIMLKSEHEAIRPLAQSLTELARAAQANGFSIDAWKQFHELALEIIEREAFHIQKEEMALLTSLDSVLEPGEDEKLTRAYSNLKGE